MGQFAPAIGDEDGYAADIGDIGSEVAAAPFVGDVTWCNHRARRGRHRLDMTDSARPFNP